jgi:DNA-binding beta-propeller fold protein YncE
MGNTGTVYSGNGLSTPESIAIDGLGDVWVGNAGANTVSAFNNNGSPLSAYSGGGTSAPVSVAVTPK